jgi:hypothetical protein
MSITIILWHNALHILYGIDMLSLTSLCAFGISRPKYVFLSRHIFRGSNPYCIELWSFLIDISLDHISLCLWLMCLQVISMLSRRLKGKWSLRRRQGFHSTLSVLSTLRHHSTLSLQFWYNLHSYYCLPKGEKVVPKGLYFTLSIRFWRFMPKGEKVLAQSKRTAPPTNFKNSWFSKWYLFFKLVSLCV